MKYKLAICSLFRDSQRWNGIEINQVDLFFKNYNKQILNTDIELEFFCLEGDSKDSTYLKLEEYSKYFKINIIKCDVKGRAPCSDGGEDRRKLLSQIGNICLNSAINYNLILWTESDLIPSEGMIKQLLKDKEELNWKEIAAIAPTCTININGNNCFYDGWAYEGKDEQKWGVPELEKFRKNHKYLEMKSVGCCALLNGMILRNNKIDFGQGNFPELCRNSIEKGYKIYCNTQLDIIHPSDRGEILGRWV